MLGIRQDVPIKPGLLDGEGQGHLVQIGAFVRDIGVGIDGLGHIIPDLGEAAAIGGAVLFGEGKQARGEVGHFALALFLFHQLDAVGGQGQSDDVIDQLPAVLIAPAHPGGGGKGHFSGGGYVIHAVGAQAQDIAVHETGEFGIARFHRGKDLVAMGIGRVKPPFDLKWPYLAVQGCQGAFHHVLHKVQFGGRAVADQCHTVAELFAQRRGQVAGHHLIIGRFNDEKDGQAWRHGTLGANFWRDYAKSGPNCHPDWPRAGPLDSGIVNKFETINQTATLGVA